jgi:hypothetical protein
VRALASRRHVAVASGDASSTDRMSDVACGSVVCATLLSSILDKTSHFPIFIEHTRQTTLPKENPNQPLTFRLAEI